MKEAAADTPALARTEAIHESHCFLFYLRVCCGPTNEDRVEFERPIKPGRANDYPGTGTGFE
jgi:hypothetical protein